MQAKIGNSTVNILAQAGDTISFYYDSVTGDLTMLNPLTMNKALNFTASPFTFTYNGGNISTTPITVTNGQGTYNNPWDYSTYIQNGTGWYVNVPNQNAATPVYIS